MGKKFPIDSTAAHIAQEERCSDKHVKNCYHRCEAPHARRCLTSCGCYPTLPIISAAFARSATAYASVIVMLE